MKMKSLASRTGATPMISKGQVFNFCSDEEQN